MPCTTSHQQHRSNPSHDTPRDYYCCVVTAPMLDHLSSQLEEIFSDISLCYINEFLNLLPSKLIEFDTFGRLNIPTLITFYIDDLPEDFML